MRPHPGFSVGPSWRRSRYDPIAEHLAQRKCADLAVQCPGSVDEMNKGWDTLVVMTDRDQFQHLSRAELAKAVRRRTVLDARNIVDRPPRE